jgi:hypothetical protein
MDEPEFEPNPPNAVDVARRAAILKYQFVRMATTPPPEILDGLAASWSQSDRDAFHATLEQHRTEIVAALRERGLWGGLEPRRARDLRVSRWSPYDETSSQHIVASGVDRLPSMGAGPD